jgi:hypothetical protein
VPGAPLGPRPLEDREVPVSCSVSARPCVPGAPLGPRPLEDREVPVRCSLEAIKSSAQDLSLPIFEIAMDQKAHMK